MKWYILWDALMRNRTGGALMRLMVPLPQAGSEAAAGHDLKRFDGALSGQLSRYVPD